MYLTQSSIYSLLEGLPEGQLFVLADRNAAAHCLPIFTDFIGKIPYHVLTIEAGEANKNLTTVELIWNFLFKNHATRQAVLINLGGGMVSDIGGFAAATYMRGIRFVNIPTTLLAMVDAASGGKTGIDYQGVKNGVGLFAEPMATLVNAEFLYSLSEQELLSGLAEMLKHALIASPEEWVRLLQILDEGVSKDRLIMMLSDTGALQASITIKAQVVAQDPHEQGPRRVLNFGHTIGHAIESAALQGKAQPHGYCVLWGMVAEVYLSVVRMGCPREVLQQLVQIMLQYYGKPMCNCKEREQLIQRMYHDKKNAANKKPNFTLLKNVGQAVVDQYITEVDIDEALEYLFSL